jgi:hypothetical protein
VSEQLVAGEALFQKSNDAILAEMIWAGITSKGYVGDSKDEIPRFFMILGPQGMVDMGAVTKVLKDCGIVGKGKGFIDTQKSDMIFTKVKGPSEKKLDFKRFIEFLYVISALVVSDYICAKYLYTVDVPFLTFDFQILKVEVSVTRKGEEEKTTRSVDLDKSTLEILSAVENYRFYRLSGRPALIVSLVYDYLATKSSLYVNMIEDLKRDGNLKSEQRARSTIENAVKRLQSFFMKRILRIRREKKMNLNSGGGFQVTQFLACYKIQRMVRAALSRRRLVKRAQQSYVKYVNENGKFYWKHFRTHEIVWKKPKSLVLFNC